MKVIIKRAEYTDKQVTGILEIYDNKEFIFKCYTLELDWEDNKKSSSCIPSGLYSVNKIKSGHRTGDFHVLNVPGRTSILIHSGNYHTHSKGCILVGKTLTDINNDGYKDVTSSKETIKKLNEILPDKFILEIKK